MKIYKAEKALLIRRYQCLLLSDPTKRADGVSLLKYRCSLSVSIESAYLPIDHTVSSIMGTRLRVTDLHSQGGLEVMSMIVLRGRRRIFR
jgi:hypothetical protein